MNAQLGPKSAILLGEMLYTNKGLKHLDLGYNSLTESGISEIFKALEENRVLEHIDVTSNNVGPAACCVLASCSPASSPDSSSASSKEAAM